MSSRKGSGKFVTNYLKHVTLRNFLNSLFGNPRAKGEKKTRKGSKKENKEGKRIR